MRVPLFFTNTIARYGAAMNVIMVKIESAVVNMLVALIRKQIAFLKTTIVAPCIE